MAALSGLGQVWKKSRRRPPSGRHRDRQAVALTTRPELPLPLLVVDPLSP